MPANEHRGEAGGMKAFQTETDSMSEMRIPADAPPGAPAARALDKIPISSPADPAGIHPHSRPDQATCRPHRLAGARNGSSRAREVAVKASGLGKAGREALLDPANQTETGARGAGP